MTESEFIRHEPCPDCGSSDALALYTDGHQYCFSCQTRKARWANTLIKCKQMLILKDQPKGCKNEESVKKPAKNTKSIETRHTYASLISMALDVLKDSK